LELVAMNQLLMALALCSAELNLGGRPCCDPPGYGQGAEMGGDMGYALMDPNNPCYRGTIFNSLKIVKSYRDNEAFAFTHFEGKRLQVSGRLVQVRRDSVQYVLVDPVTKKPVGPLPNTVALPGAYQWSADTQEVFTALVTPDGKPPTPVLNPDGTIKPAFGLEFRFPLSQLNTPAKRCAVAALWAGQFVTLKGDARGAIKEGEYTGIIFENAEIVP
jgi:hypothetical protein